MSASSAHNICIHEEKITDFFGESACQYQGSAPLTEHCTFIIFLNRSGSNLLANYLTASGQFFGGGENLNWDTVIDTAKRKGFESFHDYMTSLTQRNKWNRNKRFLIKSATSQLRMLSRFGYLPHIAPKIDFILITRRDITAQAISLSIASQTKKWTSFQEGNGQEPVVDFETIDHIREGIKTENRASEQLIRDWELTPYRIVYEDFVNSPVQQTQDLCDHLIGQRPEIDTSKIKHEKQSDDFSKQIQKQYVSARANASKNADDPTV
jgi:LPS sulfotransferase NodH